MVKYRDSIVILGEVLTESLDNEQAEILVEKSIIEAFGLRVIRGVP